MTKRITALILSIICCLGLLTACYDKQIDGEIIKGAEITLYLGEQVLDLDPALCYNNDSALQICGLIYDTLFTIDEKGNVVDGDKLMEEALEAGAADFAEEGDVYEIYCEPDDLSAVADELTAKGYTFISSEVEKVPSTYVALESEDDIKFMNLLLENLEEHDDVMNVYHNWENCDD